MAKKEIKVEAENKEALKSNVIPNIIFVVTPDGKTRTYDRAIDGEGHNVRAKNYAEATGGKVIAV